MDSKNFRDRQEVQMLAYVTGQIIKPGEVRVIDRKNWCSLLDDTTEIENGEIFVVVDDTWIATSAGLLYSTFWPMCSKVAPPGTPSPISLFEEK